MSVYCCATALANHNHAKVPHSFIMASGVCVDMFKTLPFQVQSMCRNIHFCTNGNVGNGSRNYGDRDKGLALCRVRKPIEVPHDPS